MNMKYVFVKNEHIICKNPADGPVLIDPYRRTLMRLNPVAERIWQLLDGKSSAAEIMEKLGSEFDVDAQRLKKDSVSFLKDLLKREIIK